MILALTDMFAPEQIAVLATDYADELLEKCRAGTYPLAAYSAIPEQYRKYLRVSGEAFTFTDEIRQCVKTANLNLLTGFRRAETMRDTVKCFDIELSDEDCKLMSEKAAPAQVPVLDK